MTERFYCTACKAESEPGALFFCASCGRPLERPSSPMAIEASMTPARRRVRLLLAAGYVAAAAGAVVYMFQLPTGYETLEYLAVTVGYGIAVVAVVILATHLPSGALNAGVRRAFQLTAMSIAGLAAGSLFVELRYFERHVLAAYKVAAAAFVLGLSLHAIAYWLWSQEHSEVREVRSGCL